MGYSRSYYEEIPVHYSDTISDSEGNTHSVSGVVYEPVHINIYVDTDDFDSEVSSCANHVTGLTTAIAATEAAEVATKRETSTKVADTIIKGFFNFVSRDLEQQIVELDSKCNSKLLELVEQKKECEKKKSQMNQDYNRISKNYSKLFNDLDSELSTRLHNLDLPTFAASKEIESVVSKSVDSEIFGLGTISVSETSKMNAILACSSVKRRTKETIAKANDYIAGVHYLNQSIERIVTADEDYGEKCLPIVFIESVGEGNPVERRLEGLTEQVFGNSKNVESKLIDDFSNPAANWVDMDPKESAEIDAFLNNEIQNSGLDSRVIKTMLDIKANSQIKEIKA